MFISIQLITIPVVNLQIRVDLLLVQTSRLVPRRRIEKSQKFPEVVSKENDKISAEASPNVQPGFLAY